jgi:hypothetical protein
MITVAPLRLTLYGVDNEIKRELTRSIIPWGILERAIDLQEELENVQMQDGAPVSISREQVDKLTDFVVFIFDDTVTREELKRGASVAHMLQLYQQIFRMVSQIMPRNPTTAPTEALKKVRRGRK